VIAVFVVVLYLPPRIVYAAADRWAAIAIAAVYRSVRVLAPGGELTKSYDRTDRAMAALGLAVTEKPDVSFETRERRCRG
jgi:hypothetical protein